MILRYASFVPIEELAPGVCTLHRAANAKGRWWLLCARVAADTDGHPFVWGVPVAPNGTFTENGPGGRTWALTRVDATSWQVAPSINVHAPLPFGTTRPDLFEVHAGPRPEIKTIMQSIWHHTPTIVGVNDAETWVTGQAP